MSFSSFVYRDRGIRSGFLNRNGLRIYMFQDQMLMAEESSTFIKMIVEKKRVQKEFDSESRKFGKISILSNVKDDPETIYGLYKQREEIEQASASGPGTCISGDRSCSGNRI